MGGGGQPRYRLAFHLKGGGEKKNTPSHFVLQDQDNATTRANNASKQNERPGD